jgi:branched-chain amino acid transport system substrate-binding protein
MSNRRQFVTQSAAAASALAFPMVGGAQPKPVKVGILHPVTGALAFSGQQCRAGALLAIEDINRTGIRSMGGAKLEVLLGVLCASPRPAAPRSRR